MKEPNSPRRYVLFVEKANAPSSEVEHQTILPIIGSSPYDNAIRRAFEKLIFRLKNCESSIEITKQMRVIRDFLFVHQISNIAPNLPLSIGKIVPI